jgi:hypothetical protein
MQTKPKQNPAYFGAFHQSRHHFLTLLVQSLARLRHGMLARALLGISSSSPYN